MIKSAKCIYFAKLIALAPLLLVLGACASAGKKNIPSAQIKYAPAIEVPYSEVVEDVAEHIGVNVRWGGQIIAAEDVAEVTRLTVLAMPLAETGRPSRRLQQEFEGGRFIVEMKDFDESSNNQLITVYGPISGEEILRNGKKQKVIPVVTALESRDWNAETRPYTNKFHLGLSYNGLGSRYYGRHYYGHGYSSYGNYYSFFPYGYVSRGHRFHRHGRRH